jgi:hypothetical protein
MLHIRGELLAKARGSREIVETYFTYERRISPAASPPCADEQNYPRTDQSEHPQQIEVDPSTPQKSKSNPFVNHHGGGSGRHQHGECVDANGHHSDATGAAERSDLGRRPVVAVRGTWRHPEQHGYEHEPGAVRGRHQKRPKQKLTGANLHSNAPSMARKKAVQAKCNESECCADLKSDEVDEGAQYPDRNDDSRDRQCVAHGDRQHRLQHQPATSLLKAASHGEQPTHCWIQAVKGAQTRERPPGPRGIHRHRECDDLAVTAAYSDHG